MTLLMQLSSMESVTILIWVIPVCYFNASNDKHSQTHHSIYI
jgi:hypothetical protein